MSAKASPLTLPAARVVAWRVARQRLLAGQHATTPEAVARDLVGVQAQVVSAAALAVAVRSVQGRVEDAAAALDERRLVRSWAMRGTLHLFAADDLPTVIAAIGRDVRWGRTAWLAWFGVTAVEMEAAIEMVGEILDDGRPRTRGELREELAARLGPHSAGLLRSSWGSFLYFATSRGYLCHAASDDGAVRFTHPRRWLGGWRDEDHATALGVLVERYLAAYGPASLREITRWWGVANQRDLAPVIAGLGERLTEVDVNGHRGWLRSQDVAAIEAAEALEGAVQLLGPFDPLVVGAGLRAHLIPGAHLKRVSRTAGWISPVVLVDGAVAGIWDHARSGGTLTITVEPFSPLSRAGRTRVERAARRIAAAHGAEASVAYGPVFRGP